MKGAGTVLSVFFFFRVIKGLAIEHMFVYNLSTRREALDLDAARIENFRDLSAGLY